MTDGKSIKIRCESADALPLDELTPYHSRLKSRDDKDIETLAGYITQYGFSMPFFVWRRDDDNLILDGNGRYIALNHLRKNGYTLPESFPVVYVNCRDEVDAQRKILELNNQNGVLNRDALLNYTAGLRLNYKNLRIAGMDVSGTIRPKKIIDPAKVCHCPHCGTENKVN
jgi:hypothetical protein